MRRNILIAIGVLVVVAAAAIYFLTRPPGMPQVYAVTVVKTMPHDAEAFTEGLFFQDGALYESTGEVGTSGIRKVDPATGTVGQKQDLPFPYFGEGIVAWKDRLYQVTWKDQSGFIYNLKDFSKRGTFSYEGEGWGMTHDGKSIILSDGTPELRFLDPETLKLVSKLKVTANGCPVRDLNELEWVDGEIYANIWQTNLIARIDPKTGAVKSFLDVSTLGPHSSDADAVPNGIAYDASAKRLFVTGKLWPELYEVKQGETVASSEAASKLMACSK
jgi:glutamine cyclotransferase